MKDEQKTAEQGPGESLKQVFVTFGDALSEVFNDPELKAKAKELGTAASASATLLGNRFKDDEVRDRFRKAADAAEQFGKSVARHLDAHRGS